MDYCNYSDFRDIMAGGRRAVCAQPVFGRAHRRADEPQWPMGHKASGWRRMRSAQRREKMIEVCEGIMRELS